MQDRPLPEHAPCSTVTRMSGSIAVAVVGRHADVVAQLFAALEHWKPLLTRLAGPQARGA